MFLKKPNFTWISEKIEIQHSRIFFGKTKKKLVVTLEKVKVSRIFHVKSKPLFFIYLNVYLYLPTIPISLLDNAPLYKRELPISTVTVMNYILI